MFSKRTFMVILAMYISGMIMGFLPFTFSILGNYKMDPKAPEISVVTRANGTVISKQENYPIDAILVTNRTINKTLQKRCNLMVNRIYKRFYVLQNPKNCTTARKLICGHWPSGMGSTLHHWIDCFIFAYHTNRTMLIDISKWSYLKSNKVKDGVEKFEDLFLPVSKCQYNDYDKKNEANWTRAIDKDPDSKIHAIRLDHAYTLFENFKVMPAIYIYAIPNDIIDQIIDFKYEPMAWWIGLIANYIIRPNKNLREFILQSIIRLKFQSPIVGLHIRRTDKVIRESKAFPIESYMAKVHQFYNNITKTMNIRQKRVFVSTDEPKLITKLIQQYPNYTFVHPPIDELTSDYKTGRYSAKHLKYFIRDVYLLALSDYLVVTMSSNVGRLAYELHELFYIESHSRQFTTLDRDYCLISIWPDRKHVSIMRGIKNCPASNWWWLHTRININVDDIIDYNPKVKSTKDIYYGYSRRLKKSGYFRSDCVRFIVNRWNFRDYSKMDSTARIENGTNMSTMKQWGEFYCSKV